MQAFDQLNDRFGRGTVHLGSTGASDGPRRWAMRQERLSPQYTTRWSDLPWARA
jgi:DNA polymerase V